MLRSLTLPVAAINIVMFMVACKSDQAKEPSGISQEPFALAVTADALPVEMLSEVKGYDAEGEVQCLPLDQGPGGAACIPRPEPLTAPCAAVNGELMTCQDCARICSRPLATP